MPPPNEQPQFPITQWTAVVQVCLADDEDSRRQALTAICRDYWYPLYAFARRLGHNQYDAEDLTQGFFGYFVKHNVLATASRELGKLRTFLLTVFQRYIRDVAARQNALKRGGKQTFVSFDLLSAEDLYRHEPVDTSTPETLYERSWALHVLRSAQDALRQIEIKAGRGGLHATIAPFLDPATTGTAHTAQAALALSMTVEAVRQAISRLRRKFRDVLRQQIASTLRDPSEGQIDEELTAMLAALRG